MDEADEARRILDKAIFELEIMIGNGCINYSRLLFIMKGNKVHD